MKHNNKHVACSKTGGEQRFPLKKSILAMSGVLLATLGTAGVQAQETSETPALEEIIVTGTLIRGIEVTGLRLLVLTPNGSWRSAP